jgi:hypothetical protein
MHTTKKRIEKKTRYGVLALAAIIFYNLNKPHTIIHKCHISSARTTCLKLTHIITQIVFNRASKQFMEQKVLEFMDDKRYTNLLKLSSKSLV